MTCDICPHTCPIPTGEVGKCGVIREDDGQLINPLAGHCSTVAVEPIEKRPFFHLLPGSKFLSVGFFGCPFHCLYCQNHKVSQQVVGKSKKLSPQELVDLALSRQVQGIAFTYNEPVIYHDYIEEVGHEIGRRSLDLKLVVKTNGFARPWVIRNLCLYTDGINVDLKGSDEDYERICGGWLDPVTACIEQILDMEIHLEISYLVLPSRIHDERFNIYLRNWLANLDPDIPLHLLYFYPFHKMVIPTYRPSELLKLRDIFRKKLNHVYISNHFALESADSRHTYCPLCDSTMIVRQRGTTISHLNCCGVNLPGLF